jgi:hypothetical protein
LERQEEKTLRTLSGHKVFFPSQNSTLLYQNHLPRTPRLVKQGYLKVVVMFVDSYMLRSSRGLVLGVVFCSHTRVLAQLDCFVWSSVASCCVVLLCLADRPFILELTFTLLISVSDSCLWYEHSILTGGISGLVSSPRIMFFRHVEGVRGAGS